MTIVITPASLEYQVIYATLQMFKHTICQHDYLLDVSFIDFLVLPLPQFVYFLLYQQLSFEMPIIDALLYPVYVSAPVYERL